MIHTEKALPGRNKCVFLDRDGVLNVERGDYTWRTEDFEVVKGVPEALAQLKAAGYLLVVITNQGGIAKGLYTSQDVKRCHEKLQKSCGGIIDALYYAPGHPDFSASLSRKPGSLLLEKAIARFGIDPEQSWLVGDQLRDLHAAEAVGVKAVLVGEWPEQTFERQAKDLQDALRFMR